MKKYLFLSLLLAAAYPGKGQIIISLLLGDKLNTGKIEFGLEGGFDWANLKNLEGSKAIQGFNLGFYFDIKTKNPAWMVSTGVIVKSPMGARSLPVYPLNDDGLDSAFVGGSVARKLRYFNVPIMMKYNFKNNVFVRGGIQLGLRSKCFDEFTNEYNDKDDLKYKLNVKDQVHALDAGLTLGFGYRLMQGNGMNLNLQYYYGFVDVIVEDRSPSQFNRVLYLTASIPIGKNPKND